MKNLSLTDYKERIAIGIILHYNYALANAIDEMVRPNDGSRGRKDLRSRRDYAFTLFENLRIEVSPYYLNPALDRTFRQQKKNTGIMLQQWKVIDDYMASRVERWMRDEHNDYKYKNRYSAHPAPYTPRYRDSDFVAQTCEDYDLLQRIYELDDSQTYSDAKDPSKQEGFKTWFNVYVFNPWNVFLTKRAYVNFAIRLASQFIPNVNNAVGKRGEIYDKVTKEPVDSTCTALKAQDVDMNKAAKDLLAFVLLCSSATTTKYSFANLTIPFTDFAVAIWDSLFRTADGDSMAYEIAADMCSENMEFAINANIVSTELESNKAAEIAKYYKKEKCNLGDSKLLFNATGIMKESEELRKGVIDNAFRAIPLCTPRDLPQTRGGAYGKMFSLL